MFDPEELEALRLYEAGKIPIELIPTRVRVYALAPELAEALQRILEQVKAAVKDVR